MELGHRLRARRQELGLSLRELAERVDLTASFLSQIERDLASPSIESLRKISDALEVPIFHFLVEPDVKSPVVRREERALLKLSGSNLTYHLMTPDLNRKMEVFLAEREPGEEKITIPLRQQTEEFIYVLQGQLEIELGEDTYMLGPGDSAYFDGPLLRRLAACGDTTLRFISVITPPIF
ncbi:MAG: XRE family transcriptional regulator [Anaerolineae bacterium]|jgi:transcriptional regulator with XRE-family HTH domain